MSEDHVYVGRPSKWGNPYSHKMDTLAVFKTASRKDSVASYERYLLSNEQLMEDLHELKFKTLVCWCHPKPCHADVLKKFVDRLERGIPPTLF